MLTATVQQAMNYEIIDFHTHPFTDAATNICSTNYCNRGIGEGVG